jgi:hypothetical protein
MLRGETTIGKVLARCPSGTEPIHARLRLSHLFAGADIAPPGFPPRAVLVIRRVRAASRVLLTSGVAVSTRVALERELREQVSTLWRRAARPVRGRVPAEAEAVLFEDESEWLAALGLACARREAWSHWCWREWHKADAAIAPTRALVRGWAESPRFIPAALVRLARWGEAARVLGSLQPAESGALLSALRSEFQLPSPPRLPALRDTRAEIGGDEQNETRIARQTTTDGAHASAAPSRRGGGMAGQEQLREDPSGRASVEAPSAAPPPWRRWLPSNGGACERLHATSRSLLSFAAALFYAPPLARSRDFATEVFAYNESKDAPAPPPADAPRAHAGRPSSTRSRRAESLPAVERQGVAERPRVTFQEDATRDTPRELSVEADTATRPALERDEAGQAAESLKTRTARSDGAGESKRVGVTSAADAVESEAVSTAEEAAPWARLDGCETRLGGVLFLLNLLVGLRLPECFDEDYALSEQITGWGLTELLARALLGETAAEFEDDPLWGALAYLDGRAAGEPPAAGLRVGHAYRAPARWLKLFAPREGEDAWGASVVEDALIITHAAGFPVTVLPLEGRDATALAAQLADEYRAQGLSISLSLSARGGSPTVREGVGLPPRRELSESHAHPHGRASASELRRWMSWTFPFLKYALCRSLADAGGVEDGAAARALIVRRGRLYCTATHVDLVLELSGLSFEARRAGLDASPGWVRDLMRVVAFHFE